MTKPSLPRAPKGLQAAGKAQWRAGLATLASRGDPSRYTLALEQLSRCVDQLRAAESDLAARGATLDSGVRNPSGALVARLSGQVAKLLDAMGMTPRAEQKLTGRRPKPQGEETGLVPIRNAKTGKIELAVAHMADSLGTRVHAIKFKMSAGRRNDPERRALVAKYRASQAAATEERERVRR